MHYNTEDLYFYKKEGSKDKCISDHLSKCAQCSEKAAATDRLSGLFASSLENPPPMRLKISVQSGRRFVPVNFLKPVLAFSLSAMVLFSGAFVLKTLFTDRARQNELPAFIYETYSTIYDYDYYKTNYMDKTEIKLNGGFKNETF